MIDSSLNASLERLKGRARANEKACRDWIAQQPQFVTCEKHGTKLRISFDLTYRLGYQIGGPNYEPCPKCTAEAKHEEFRQWCISIGIPPKLAGVTLDTLEYDSENDRKNLEKIKRWSETPIGFLVLLGGVGVGKSHIGSAILGRRRQGLFTSQDTLLSELRRSYHDRTAKEYFADRYKKTPLLVLDEVGVSSGGRDEYPLLHSLIAYRYDWMTPTIITSNMDPAQFKATLGDRLVDRIREASAATGVLTFRDVSKRAGANQRYLELAAKHQPEHSASVPSEGEHDRF